MKDYERVSESIEVANVPAADETGRQRQSLLLAELRIDRAAPAARRASRRWVRVLTPLLVLAVGSTAGVWVLLGRADAIPIQVAVAQEAEPRLGSPAVADSNVTVLDASGYIVARRQATVSAKITGKVVEVLIEEGQRVEEGEIIARLDESNTNAQLNEARARLAHAEAAAHSATTALRDSRATFERMERIYAAGQVSAQAFDDARAAYNAAEGNSTVAARAIDVARAGVAVTERAHADVVVRAPFAGVVTVKAAQPGEIVSPISAGGGFTRTGIGTIVDMSSLEVEVDVGESYITRVRAGQAANVTLNAYPEWTIPAKVIAIIPTADRAKATVKVRVKLLEPDERLLPDMGARVSFLDTGRSYEDPSHASRASIVPAGAVLVEGDEGVVYVVSGNRVERRTVALGAAAVHGQEILSGISPGTKVAIGNVGRLSDGVAVRVTD